MTAQTALAAGRRAAEALMTDTCTITRPTTTPDPDGLDRITEVPVWEGRCKVQTYEAHETAAQSAGALVVTQRYSIHIPHNVGAVRVGDLIRVTGYLSVFRVTGLFDKTYATSRRFQVDVETNRDDIDEGVGP